MEQCLQRYVSGLRAYDLKENLYSCYLYKIVQAVWLTIESIIWEQYIIWNETCHFTRGLCLSLVWTTFFEVG